MAATICWDPWHGNDANDGSTWALAVQNLHGATGASAKAAAKGHIKLAGLLRTDLGNATWTAGSTTVTFAADPSAVLAAGDIIYPSDATYAQGPPMPFQVSSVTGVTVVLREAWRGTTTTYDTWLVCDISDHILAAAQTMTTGATGQKITVGWNTTSDLQDSTTPSVLYYASADMLTINQADTLLDNKTGTLMLCVAYNAGYHCLVIAANMRQTGVLLLHGGTAIAIHNDTASIVELAYIYCSFNNTSYGVYTVGSSNFVRCMRLIAWNAGRSLTINSRSISEWTEIIENNCVTSVTVLTDNSICCIGHLKITSGAAPSVAAGFPASQLAISYLTAVGTTPTGLRLDVGGPVASTRIATPDGVTTRPTEGYDADAYGAFMLNPSSAAAGNLGVRPTYVPDRGMGRPVTAGAALTLKFRAVYTGTVSNVPPCWIELVEPNGFTVQQYTFTPDYSAEAAIADIWADATTLQSIVLAGTALVNGRVSIRFAAIDNLAGDAVVYVDNVTWVVA